MDLRSIINSDAPAAASRAGGDAARREASAPLTHHRNASYLSKPHATSPTAYSNSSFTLPQSPVQQMSPVRDSRLPNVASLASPSPQQHSAYLYNEKLGRTSTHPTLASPVQTHERYAGQYPDGNRMTPARPILHAHTQPVSSSYSPPTQAFSPSPSPYHDTHQRRFQHQQQPLSAMTPTSMPFHAQQNHLDSPMSVAPHSAHTSNAQQSLPGTPLGPPLNYTRTMSNGHKEHFSPRGHRRSYTTSSPADVLTRTESDRERSVSISPKTRLSNRNASVDMKVAERRKPGSFGYSISPRSAGHENIEEQRFQHVQRRKSTLVALPDQSVALANLTEPYSREPMQMGRPVTIDQLDGTASDMPQAPEQDLKLKTEAQSLQKRSSPDASPDSADRMQISRSLEKQGSERAIAPVVSDASPDSADRMQISRYSEKQGSERAIAPMVSNASPDSADRMQISRSLEKQDSERAIATVVSDASPDSADRMQISRSLEKQDSERVIAPMVSDASNSIKEEHNSTASIAQQEVKREPTNQGLSDSPSGSTADRKSPNSKIQPESSQSPKPKTPGRPRSARSAKQTNQPQPQPSTQPKNSQLPPKPRPVPAWARRAQPGQIVSLKRNGGQHSSSKAAHHNQVNGYAGSGDHHTDKNWQEPSITLERPYDEVSRELCDFLDAFVVSNDGWRSLDGVKLEIEAKIGMLIDDMTGERLSLPIRTETVLDSNKIEVRFQSFITVEHHKSINAFLNDAFTKSQTASRSPMRYKHTKERDIFYDFHPDEHFAHLPPSAQNILSPSGRTRIRVSRDETGHELSKIVKHRVEDLSIYSPGTEFDYRISLNLEFPYSGSTDGLVEAKERGAKKERFKDRMTYWHQHYRIDFTQAKPSDNKADWTHELEIELDEQKLYHYGKGDRMAYERYVAGLVNNLRVLARSTKEPFVPAV